MPPTRQCAFLVGGRGGRLGGLTDAVPKPMIPVAGRPFLDYLLDAVVRQGFDDILLFCGYKSNYIAEYYKNGWPGARIRVVTEPEPAGTAGALRYGRELLAEEFLVCNGDSFFDVDILAQLRRTAASDCIAKLALRYVKDTARFGAVELEGDRIVAFAEKQRSGPGYINGGVYLLKWEILDRIAALPCSIEQDIFPSLVVSGQIYGCRQNRPFIDIGIPEELARAQVFLPRLLRRPAVLLPGTACFEPDGNGGWRPRLPVLPLLTLLQARRMHLVALWPAAPVTLADLNAALRPLGFMMDGSISSDAQSSIEAETLIELVADAQPVRAVDETMPLAVALADLSAFDRFLAGREPVHP